MESSARLSVISAMRTKTHVQLLGRSPEIVALQQEVERVDHTLSPEDLTVIGSELESVALNRAIKWHAERRVFRNGTKTVVLR